MTVRREWRAFLPGRSNACGSGSSEEVDDLAAQGARHPLQYCDSRALEVALELTDVGSIDVRVDFSAPTVSPRTSLRNSAAGRQHSSNPAATGRQGKHSRRAQLDGAPIDGDPACGSPECLSLPAHTFGNRPIRHPMGFSMRGAMPPLAGWLA